jgi:hypothetical protein
MPIQSSYWDVTEGTYSVKSSPFPFLPLKEILAQQLKIKNRHDIFHYERSETTTQTMEERESEQFIYSWLLTIKPLFEQEQKPEELKQQALSLIVRKFSKIKKVKSIYVQRYRGELQIFVLLLGNRYDADLMDHLLDIEYEIRKMFPDIVFQFFYPPAGISEKKDFIHPQAECIYMNPSLPSEVEENDVLEEIEEVYEFSNKERVKAFILQNSDLIKILKEAPAHIYKIFGKVKLVLELHSDLEENWDELFIIIKSSYPPEKAYELEKKLFEEWFADIIKIVGNKLNFTEEPL